MRADDQRLRTSTAASAAFSRLLPLRHFRGGDAREGGAVSAQARGAAVAEPSA